jgi:hypothetical protein
MDFEELPESAKEAFREVGKQYTLASLDVATQEKYVNGLEQAVLFNSYAKGLADKFNMSPEEFIGVEEQWVESLDSQAFIEGMVEAGINERVSKAYAEAILDD